MSRLRRRGSGSSLENLSFDDDDFDRQDVTAVLPPNARSRRASAVEAQLHPHTPQSSSAFPRVKPTPRASATRRQDQRDWYYGEVSPPQAWPSSAPSLTPVNGAASGKTSSEGQAPQSGAEKMPAPPPQPASSNGQPTEQHSADSHHHAAWDALFTSGAPEPYAFPPAMGTAAGTAEGFGVWSSGAPPSTTATVAFDLPTALPSVREEAHDGDEPSAPADAVPVIVAAAERENPSASSSAASSALSSSTSEAPLETATRDASPLHGEDLGAHERDALADAPRRAQEQQHRQRHDGVLAGGEEQRLDIVADRLDEAKGAHVSVSKPLSPSPPTGVVSTLSGSSTDRGDIHVENADGIDASSDVYSVAPAAVTAAADAIDVDAGTASEDSSEPDAVRPAEPLEAQDTAPPAADAEKGDAASARDSEGPVEEQAPRRGAEWDVGPRPPAEEVTVAAPTALEDKSTDDDSGAAAPHAQDAPMAEDTVDASVSHSSVNVEQAALDTYGEEESLPPQEAPVPTTAATENDTPINTGLSTEEAAAEERGPAAGGAPASALTPPPASAQQEGDGEGEAVRLEPSQSSRRREAAHDGTEPPSAGEHHHELHSAPLTPEYAKAQPGFDTAGTAHDGTADDAAAATEAATEVPQSAQPWPSRPQPSDAKASHPGGDDDGDENDGRRGSLTEAATFPQTQPVAFDDNHGADDADATEFDEFTVDVGRQSSFDSVHKDPADGADEEQQQEGGQRLSQGAGVPQAHSEAERGEEDEAPLRVVGAPTPSGSSSLFENSMPAGHTSQPAAPLGHPPTSHHNDEEEKGNVKRDSGPPSTPSHTRVFIPAYPQRPSHSEETGPVPSAPEEEDSHSLRIHPPPSAASHSSADAHANAPAEEEERTEALQQPVVAAAAAATSAAPADVGGGALVHFAEHLNTFVPPPEVASTSAESSPRNADIAVTDARTASRSSRYDELDNDEMDAVVDVRPLSRRPEVRDGIAESSERPSPRVAGDDTDGATISVGEARQRMTEDELQEARMRTYDETCTISTLDFLRETGDSVLPNAVASMFAATGNFFQSSKDALTQRVPQPLRAAANRTGRSIALFADFTGDIITNAPEYLLTIIPDSLLSEKTKQLIAVDFLAVLRVTLDVNILAVPYVFRMAGLVGGLVLLIAMHPICYYNTMAFFAAKNQLRDAATVVMYGDVPRMTWGKWFPMLSLWYGAAFLIAYITYAASNLQVLLARMGITGGQATALAFIMPSVFALPLVFMKKASTQKPLAAIASLLVFISVIMFMSAFPYHTADQTAVEELPLWASDVAEFFIALVIAVYIFTPLRTAVPVERSMSPRRFTVLLRVAMSIAFCCHLIFGICAFVTLRKSTCSVLAVSLPAGPVETTAAAILFFAFVCIIPLAQFRMGELCDRRVLGVRTLPSYWQLGPNVMRMLFLAGAMVVAYVMPHYGLLVGLGGAFGCGIIGLVVPAALDYVRRERAQRRRGRHLAWWEYAMVFSSLLFGAVGVVALGVIFSFYQIWAVVQAGYKAAC